MSLEPNIDYYNTQINALKIDFFTILGGYKQKYINYFTNPTDDAESAAYDECVLQLQTKIQVLQNVSTRIQADIDTLNTKVTMISTQLGDEKLLHTNNFNLFADIQTTGSGSKIMINDYKTAYNAQYYENVELFVGIILMIGVSSKIFRK
jgi:hypothetical protein